MLGCVGLGCSVLCCAEPWWALLACAGISALVVG